jgi:hypothetical protein
MTRLPPVQPLHVVGVAVGVERGAVVGVARGGVVGVELGGVVGVGLVPPHWRHTCAPPLYAVEALQAAWPEQAPIRVHSSPLPAGPLFVQGSLPCVQYAA